MGLSRRRITALLSTIFLSTILWNSFFGISFADEESFEEWQDAISNEFQEHVSDEEKQYQAYKKEIEQ